MKSRSCLANAIPFYNKVTCLMGGGTWTWSLVLDFRKTFETISHSIILEKEQERRGRVKRKKKVASQYCNWVGKGLISSTVLKTFCNYYIYIVIE